MYFYIDESGNTGNNLFDKNQPVLSYGVLSCKTDLDLLGKTIHQKMLNELRVDALHANVLGVGELTRISHLLYDLQKKFRLNFDYYSIDKPSYALVIFFDCVFDAGLNPAVKWDSYWTPLRFLLIYKLSLLFDEALLKEAWSLCIDKNIGNRSKEIAKLLEELTKRLDASNLDSRSKEIMRDAFQYGADNPLKLDFGVSDQKIISPNAVCFQFVVSAMANRIKKSGRKDAFKILVDSQKQFNTAQCRTHYHSVRLQEGLSKLSGVDRNQYRFHPLYENLTEEEIFKIGTPKKDITISKSEDSVGLQIVDVYLWMVNRLLSGQNLSEELKIFYARSFKNSMTDDISMEGMARRWNNFAKKLPKFEDLTDEQLQMARQFRKEHRAKVKKLQN